MTINVGQRGEIVIPKKIRSEIGIRTGGKVSILIKEGQAIITPAEVNIVDTLAAIARDGGLRIKNYNSDEAYDEMMEEYTRAHRR